MPSPPRGKSTSTIRSLIKSLQATDEVIWVVDSALRIVWLSDACLNWLGGEALRSSDQLVGRSCAVSNLSDDPFDQMATTLAPPVALEVAGLQCLQCAPPGVPPRLIRYLRIGSGASAVVVASSGAAISTAVSAEANDANVWQTRLLQWRKRDATWGGIAAAGGSKSAKRLRGQIQLAASTSQDFAIVGPKGSGGEAIARRIHALCPLAPRTSTQGKGSSAPSHPIVPIDGPLMDAELLEDSLSPANALLTSDRKNVDATRVTVVVRDLDDTPLEVQHRIERFVSEHPESVRLIGLLTSTPEVALANERLIDPFAARFSILSLRIDGLASRVEDIPLIASALVDARHSAGMGVAERVSRAALDRLMLYPWPNNFDELDAAIRHAMSACHGPSIGAEHLPLAVRSYQASEPANRRDSLPADLDQAMERYELQMIQMAIEACGGNRSEAARRLKISRPRLLRRLGEPETGAS